jgi:transketolase
VLYSNILKLDPHNPTRKNRDYFILSKGHAALTLYSTLAETGFFSREELLNFKGNGSNFSSMVSSKIPGVELSTGSLGQGLGYAVGLALGLQLRQQSNQVYCLIGDGENDEGSIWESAETAYRLGLSNLTLIIDNNNQKIGGQIEKPLDFEKIYNDFGFETISVNGHDHKQLQQVFKRLTDQTSSSSKRTSPRCVIAKTIKGKGVSFLEAHEENHTYTLSEKEFLQALAENQSPDTNFLDQDSNNA